MDFSARHSHQLYKTRGDDLARGNTHMMMDLNNLQVADWTLAWVEVRAEETGRGEQEVASLLNLMLSRSHVGIN